MKDIHSISTSHVETVALLSLKTNQPKIEVSMTPSNESNYTLEEKATYKKIKDYILENTGLKISPLYIAQVKDKYGLNKERTGNIWKKDEDVKEPQCPPEKERAIMDAFRYFKWI